MVVRTNHVFEKRHLWLVFEKKVHGGNKRLTRTPLVFDIKTFGGPKH